MLRFDHLLPRFVDFRSVWWRARAGLALVTIAIPLHWSVRAAAEGERPIVVAEFQGKKSEEVRTQVAKTLTAAGYEVVDEAAAPKVDPGGSDANFVSIAEDGGYRAFVLGSVTFGKGWKTTLVIREGMTGSVVGETSISAGWFPGLLEKIDKTLIPEVEPALDQARGPDLAKWEAAAGATEAAAEEPSEPTPAEEPAEVREEKPEEQKEAPVEERVSDEQYPGASTDRRKSRDPALDLQVGGLWMQRSWELTDPVSGPDGGRMLGAHDVPFGGYRVALEVYPAAFFSTSAARHIGVEAKLERSLFARTQYPGSEIDAHRFTVFMDLTFGLRGRIPLGDTRLGLFGGVGVGQLNVTHDATTIPHPDANYRFYRAGADFMLPLGKLAEAKLSAGYRGVLSLGESDNEVQNSSWFPDATGGGLEGRIQFGFSVARNWSIRLGASGQRYGFDFNQTPQTVSDAPAAGDPAPPLAGGASDTNFGVDAGLALLLY